MEFYELHNDWLTHVENVEIGGTEKYEELDLEKIEKIIQIQNSEETGFVVFNLLCNSLRENIYDIIDDKIVDESSYLNAYDIDKYNKLKKISEDKKKWIDDFIRFMNNDTEENIDNLIRFSPDIILLTKTINELYTQKISIDDFRIGNWMIKKICNHKGDTYMFTEKLFVFYSENNVVLK
jgi:hypothetical protein